MEIKTVRENSIEIVAVTSREVLIANVQSALDFIGTILYETGSSRVIINKTAIGEEFFDLRTKLAGEVLQKFINYQIRIAIVGDFSIYTSKSLKDFIYECNKGKDIFFLPDEEQAIQKLSS